MDIFFTTDGPLQPNRPPSTGLYLRPKETQNALDNLKRIGQIAIWAPRYSGRTTFLLCLAERLRLQDERAVYISVEKHVNPASRSTLFRSLATRIALQTLQSQVLQDEWDRPDSFARFLLPLLNTSRLTLLLDDCDRIPIRALLTLLRAIRDLQVRRAQNRQWKNLSFAIAGSISSSSLELLDTSELSPFESWPPCHLQDLAPAEASQYLSQAFQATSSRVPLNIIEEIVNIAGGDLRSLNLISELVIRKHKTIQSTDPLDLIGPILEGLTASYRSDPSLSHMLAFLENDLACFQVVYRIFHEQPMRNEFELTEAEIRRFQESVFAISNQELSGAFVLLGSGQGASTDSDGHLRWRVRSEFRLKALRSHFTNSRLLATCIQLGQYSDSRTIEAVAMELSNEWKSSNALGVDEEVLRNICAHFWRKGLNRDQVAAGYDALEFLMKNVFCVQKYEILNRPTSPIAARAFFGTFQIYTEDDSIQIAIPLRDFRGEISEVLILAVSVVGTDWTTLFWRIPIIERTANSIWGQLSRREHDQYKGLTGAIPWISIQFNSRTSEYFAKRIARFPEDLPARLLMFSEGIIFRQIVAAMKEKRSLFIFELSHVNDNVLFELGLAIAFNRPGLLVREKNSRLRFPILEGLYCEEYTISSRHLSESFVDRLRDRWISHFARRDDSDYIHLLADRVLSQPQDLNLLLVIDHHYYQDSREFRRAVEKAAANFKLKVSYVWEGGSQDERFTSETIGEDTTSIIALFKRLHRARAILARTEGNKTTDHNALRFLATGLAMGFAETRGKNHCVLTGRKTDPANHVVSRPTDFNGLEVIPFDPGKTTQFIGELRERLANIFS